MIKKKGAPLEKRLSQNEDLARPKDLYSKEDWDRYWESIIPNLRTDGCDPAIIPFYRLTWPFLETFRKRNFQSILFVGNGISQEPRAFAHAGFQTTALDISPVATKFAASFPFTEKHLWYFFQMDSNGEIGDYRKIERQPGGSVSFISGDLLDRSVLPGPFDVVIVRYALDFLDLSKLNEACQSIIGRIHPDGVMIIEALNNVEAASVFKEKLIAERFNLRVGLREGKDDNDWTAWIISKQSEDLPRVGQKVREKVEGTSYTNFVIHTDMLSLLNCLPEPSIAGCKPLVILLEDLHVAGVSIKSLQQIAHLTYSRLRKTLDQMKELIT